MFLKIVTLAEGVSAGLFLAVYNQSAAGAGGLGIIRVKKSRRI